jgi:hypothetical protein
MSFDKLPLAVDDLICLGFIWVNILFGQKVGRKLVDGHWFGLLC